ncbi:Plasmodium exported protein, unknown function [Plasmodium ovale]|uniref:Uncharacterized protein n=1 Tax=Plasmodium ovale TaxID=36330 RepID=A0A1D3JDR9_PLAOA|nr:Plasmodium exported protein, unknown function [Plasmodium ovale]
MAVLTKGNKQGKNIFLFCAKVSLCTLLLWILNYSDACQYGDSYGVVNYNVGTKLNARVVRSLFAAEAEIQEESEQETKKTLRATAKADADAPEKDLDEEISSIISESNNSRKYNLLPNDWYPKITPSYQELVENSEQMKIRKRAMEGDPEALSYYPAGYWDPYLALQRAVKKKLEEERTYESYRKLLGAGFKDFPLVDDMNANQIGENEPYIERNYGGIDTTNIPGVKVPKMDKATIESKKEGVIERGGADIEIGQVGEEGNEKVKEKEKEKEKEKKKKKRFFCCC